MKQCWIIIFFLLMNSLGFSQNKILTKQELFKLFKNSNEQESKKEIVTYLNPWKSENKDSVYFKSDTIQLINYKQRVKIKNICRSINWTFYRRNRFVITIAEMCEEPTWVSAKSELYEVEIINDENEIILNLYQLKNFKFRYDEIVDDKFKVFSVEDDSEKSILTLVRLNGKIGGIED